MPPQETAGMCWAGGKSTRLLSVIWNSEALSQNLYKNNYKEITKNYCKNPSKELQYSYRKGDALLDHEIFFFLFLEYRVSAILLRLFSFTAVGGHRTGDIPLRVQKSPSGFGRAFLRPKIRRNRPTARESMTLHQLGGQFACFSAKDIYKVWRGRGLYSARICDKVYTINS